jgi:hypothetical protein
MTYGMVDGHKCFGGSYHLHLQVTGVFKMLINNCRTTWCQNPEDHNPNPRCHEATKFDL